MKYAFLLALICIPLSTNADSCNKDKIISDYFAKTIREIHGYSSPEWEAPRPKPIRPEGE